MEKSKELKNRSKRKKANKLLRITIHTTSGTKTIEERDLSRITVPTTSGTKTIEEILLIYYYTYGKE